MAEAAAVTAGSQSSFSFGLVGENHRLRKELENTVGENALLKAQLDRAEKVIMYSARYRISSDLAATIFDAALQERIDPELGFRLVNLESGFNPLAVSRVGAIGLAQVMPATGRQADASVTRQKLFEPKTNLRIGFSHLRQLIDTYDGNVQYALLAYNVGELEVDQAVKAGRDPLAGYERILLKAYRGSGITN